ncbi:MAG: hypothetical protein HC902_06190 [Calothrix sp. SM1_5_4]|nr:hypothetical protein [Calothrix sp. SM1_5_4]
MTGYFSREKIWGRIHLMRQVIVRRLDVSSKLSPVDSAGTVSLDRMEVAASAELHLDGRSFHVLWAPSFRTAEGKLSESFCKRK